MNSPVSCLPDPIQNMTKKKNNRGKDVLKSVRGMGQTRRDRVAIPAAMGGVYNKGADAMPLSVGIGKSMTVQNYEFVATLPGFATNTFANLIQGFTCNPGIAAFVPWLSTIALNYSKFRWKFLRFMYVPAVPTSIPGTVFLNASYDPLDTTPTSVADLAVTDSSSIGPAWVGGGINAEKAFRKNLNVDDAIFIDIDVKRLSQPYYYVRKQAGLDADSRPLVIYSGSYNTLNGSSYGATGGLYVSYVCELFEPVAASLNT